MSTAEDSIGQQLRSELEARVAAWKVELDFLLTRAPARIAELQALLAAGDTDDAKPVILPPRKRPEPAPGGVQTPPEKR